MDVRYNTKPWGKTLERAFRIHNPSDRDIAVDALMGVRDWNTMLNDALFRCHPQISKQTQALWVVHAIKRLDGRPDGRVREYADVVVQRLMQQ